MKVTPFFSQASAKPAFSDRKPYPGWMACAPEESATYSCVSSKPTNSNGFPLVSCHLEGNWLLQLVHQLEKPRQPALSKCTKPAETLTILTCNEFLSAVLYTAIVLTPMSRAVFITLHAISPLFAINILSNIFGCVVVELKRVRTRYKTVVGCLRVPGTGAA